MAKVHFTPCTTSVPEVTCQEYLYGFMTVNQHHTALINGTTGENVSYGEVMNHSKAMAAGLRSVGLRSGDVISTVVYNSCEFVYLVLGAMQDGGIINSINPTSTKYELQFAFKEVMPRLIVTDSVNLSKVQSALNGLGTLLEPTIILTQDKCPGYMYIQISDILWKGRLCPESDRDLTLSSPDDVALMLFSSGTTGLPKGVMLTHRNIVSSLAYRLEFMKCNSPEQLHVGMLLAAPVQLCHVAGLAVILFGIFTTGGGLLFIEQYNMESFLGVIDKYRPAGLAIPPTVMTQLVKSPLTADHDVSSIKFCIVGAGSIKQSLETAFIQRFGNLEIFQGFGMTETVGGCISRGSLHQYKPGSCGKVYPGIYVKVTDPATDRTLGPREPGEICVKGSSVMLGYHNKPDQTASTIDRDGWLHTGDIGLYDEEDYFFIVDRMKDLIKYKENQVAPAELEALLLNHDGVADVGVVGVPDAEAGEVPRAFIVKKAGANLTETDVHRYVNERVSSFKRLRGGVMFIDSIPKVASGKILRRELRNMVAPDAKL